MITTSIHIDPESSGVFNFESTGQRFADEPLPRTLRIMSYDPLIGYLGGWLVESRGGIAKVWREQFPKSATYAYQRFVQLVMAVQQNHPARQPAPQGL